MIAPILVDAIYRVIRAVIDPGDCRAFRFKAIAHPSRQVRIGILVEIAAAGAGLVRDDDDRPPQLIGPETVQFENSRNKLELVRPMESSTASPAEPGELPFWYREETSERRRALEAVMESRSAQRPRT